MRIALFLVVALSFVTASSVNAAVTSNTVHGAESFSLDGLIFSNDALSGLIPTELAGDQGWHPANTNPADQLPVFTDDLGGAGLDGLLNDNFPGLPVKRVQYDLPGATDIPGLQILTGNEGADGRVFSTTVISYSTDNGSNFTQLGYFESDLPGTLNNGAPGQWESTLVRIFDDSSADLITGATNLIFEFYSVDNTGGQYRDPFDGVNPFTLIDDGLTAAFVSPLVWEIDVIPEPSTAMLVGLAGLVQLRRRRRG